MKLTFSLLLAAAISFGIGFHLEDRELQHQISAMSRKAEDARQSVFNRVDRAASNFERARLQQKKELGGVRQSISELQQSIASKNAAYSSPAPMTFLTKDGALAVPVNKKVIDDMRRDGWTDCPPPSDGQAYTWRNGRWEKPRTSSCP